MKNAEIAAWESDHNTARNKIVWHFKTSDDREFENIEVVLDLQILRMKD